MDGAGLAGVVVAAFHVASASQVPQFDLEAWLQLIILIISLILCAMASAAETALTSISRIKLKNLVEEGDKKALEIENLISKPNVFLSTILVVNSVAVIIGRRDHCFQYDYSVSAPLHSRLWGTDWNDPHITGCIDLLRDYAQNCGCAKSPPLGSRSG